MTILAEMSEEAFKLFLLAALIIGLLAGLFRRRR
jgi:hypothetical protein